MLKYIAHRARLSQDCQEYKLRMLAHMEIKQLCERDNNLILKKNLMKYVLRITLLDEKSLYDFIELHEINSHCV